LRNTLRFALVFVAVALVCALSSCTKTSEQAKSEKAAPPKGLTDVVGNGSVTADFRAVRQGSGDVIEARFTTKKPEITFRIEGGEVLTLTRGGERCYILANKATSDKNPELIRLTNRCPRRCVLRAYRLSGAASVQPSVTEPPALILDSRNGLNSTQMNNIEDCIYKTGLFTSKDQIAERQHKIDTALGKF
jgi:hypothetical protein